MKIFMCILLLSGQIQSAVSFANTPGTQDGTQQKSQCPYEKILDTYNKPVGLSNLLGWTAILVAPNMCFVDPRTFCATFIATFGAGLLARNIYASNVAKSFKNHVEKEFSNNNNQNYPDHYCIKYEENSIWNRLFLPQIQTRPEFHLLQSLVVPVALTSAGSVAALINKKDNFLFHSIFLSFLSIVNFLWWGQTEKKCDK